MPLNYGKSSPGDVLAKARRDLERLTAAEAAEDAEIMSDALSDFAVGLTALKDWLKRHPQAAFTEADVENYWVRAWR